MGRAELRNAYKILFGNPEEKKKHVGDLCRDERVMVKKISNE
jgi:hypothetical protein